MKARGGTRTAASSDPKHQHMKTQLLKRGRTILLAAACSIALTAGSVVIAQTPGDIGARTTRETQDDTDFDMGWLGLLGLIGLLGLKCRNAHEGEYRTAPRHA